MGPIGLKSTRCAGALAGMLGLGLLSGCGLASALDQSTTNSVAWTGPQGFDTGTESAEQAPTVAEDASGNVFLAWEQVDTGANELLVNVFSAANNTWLNPQPLAGSTPSAQHVMAAVASSTGRFFYVWDQGTGPTTSQIWANNWSAGAGFGTSVQMSANTGYAPVLAMDAAGDAVIAWTEVLPDGLAAVMVLRYAVSNNGWSVPLQVSTTTSANAYAPQAGIDPSGDVVLSWVESAAMGTGPYTLQTAWFLASNQAWSAPYSPMVSPSDLIQPPASLAFTAGGARLAWSESTSGTTYQVYTASFEPALATWTAPVMASAAGVNAVQPALGLDAAGDALLAWVQWTSGLDSNPAPDLYATAFTSGTGFWSLPTAVVTGTLGVQAPNLSMSPDGNGVLAWQQYFGSNWRIFGSINAPGYGWSSVAILNVDTGGDTSAPTVYFGANDQAVATWSQPDADGVNHVYANLYQ